MIQTAPLFLSSTSCIRCDPPFAVLSAKMVSADADFLGDNGAVVGVAIKGRPRTYDITRSAWQGCAGPFTCTELIILWATHKVQTIRALGYFRFTVSSSQFFAGINFLTHSTHSFTMLASKLTLKASYSVFKYIAYGIRKILRINRNYFLK